MATQLRLVYTNPHPTNGCRLDGDALHRLADVLIAQVNAGNQLLARGRVASAGLNPLGVAVVSTWMSRAGLSEGQILEVMVGRYAAEGAMKKPAVPRSRCRHV